MALNDAADTENPSTQRHDYHLIDNEIVVRPDRYFGVRHFQALLIFLGLASSAAMRLCLLPALVEMTDPHPKSPDSQNTSSFAAHLTILKIFQYSNSTQDFDWNEKIKGYVISSFLLGYILTLILGGQLAQKYGAKPILLWSMLWSGSIVLLMPLGVFYGGWQLLCILQVILGMFQGFVFPSIQVFLSKWSPVCERAQMVTCCYSGAGFGIMTTFWSSGLLVTAFGWPSIFYSCGFAACLWSILWLFFGSSSPADCKYISANELQYIQTSLERHTGESSSRVQGLKTPWKDIFTSQAFYAFIIVNLTGYWSSNIMLIYIPTYFDGVLKLNIEKIGFLSALSSFVNFIMGFFFSFLSGFLERNDWLSLKYNRKIFNTIGQWIPALILIALGYLQEDNTLLAVVLINIAWGMQAATRSGFRTNAIDISPNFAGTLTGITTTISNILGIFLPIFVGMVLKDDSDVNGWRIVFFTSAGMFFIGNLIFILFGSTKTQTWNNPQNLNEN